MHGCVFDDNCDLLLAALLLTMQAGIVAMPDLSLFAGPEEAARMAARSMSRTAAI
jgi:hypothetical protein